MNSPNTPVNASWMEIDVCFYCKDKTRLGQLQVKAAIFLAELSGLFKQQMDLSFVFLKDLQAPPPNKHAAAPLIMQNATPGMSRQYSR